MQSSAFLSLSRCGVFLARFVIPHGKRNPTEPRDIKFSLGTKDPRPAKRLARQLRVLFDGYVMQNATVERKALTDYLKRCMKYPNPGLMPFGAEKDDNGNWKFTDVKPEDVPAIDAFIEAVERRSAAPVPLSQVALKEPLPEKFHEPGRLSPAARLRVSKHIADYLKYEQEREDEREIGVKKVPQIRTRLKPFLERFGSRQIGTLTPADLETYKKDLAFYPTNIHKLRYAVNITFDEVIRRSRKKLMLDNNDKPAPCISVNTLDGYIVVATNFLEYCKRLYAINPVALDGFNVKTKASPGVKKRAFNQGELGSIFGSDYYRHGLYNRAYQYWVPLLGAFTGARLNEIAQLAPSDIQQDDAGLWYINITTSDDDEAEEAEEAKSLKNEESRRVVPVHQRLIALGFIDYVNTQKAKGAANLYDISPAKADKHGKNPGAWFNEKYLKKHLKIKVPGISFHSFRHRFITSLAQALVDSTGLPEETIARERLPEAVILRRICGHAVSHALTAGRSDDVHTDTYTGAFTVASMKRVIDKLDYPGVNFFPYIAPTEGKRSRMKKPKSIFEITGEELGSIL